MPPPSKTYFLIQLFLSWVPQEEVIKFTGKGREGKEKGKGTAGGTSYLVADLILEKMGNRGREGKVQIALQS